jgi:hypothetical protein
LDLVITNIDTSHLTLVSVKIFDFGLARVMPEEGDPNNDAYDMSGAGSPR